MNPKTSFIAFRENRRLHLLLIGVTSNAMSLAAGYMLAAKKLENKYQSIADEQIADVKSRYKILRKEGEYGDLEELASRHRTEDIIKENGYTSYNEPATRDDIVAELERRNAEEDEAEEIQGEEAEEETTELIVTNLFESDDPDIYFNWEEELERRESTPDEPYIITREEFDQNTHEYNNSELTYFEDDGVLVDENSKIVDVDSVVGEENMTRFGAASQDRNIVFIRNEKLGLDVEVIRSDASYAKSVLGFIEHSDDGRARRFRHDD